MYGYIFMHKIRRNADPWNNDSDKWAANCYHLKDTSISQNYEESNDDQCTLKMAEDFSEERVVEDGNTVLVDIDDAALFLLGSWTCFSIRKNRYDLIFKWLQQNSYDF